jgi:hypothetical protein
VGRRLRCKPVGIATFEEPKALGALAGHRGIAPRIRLPPAVAAWLVSDFLEAV